MKTVLKILLPLAALAAGGFIAWTMVQSRPVVETRPPEVVPPLVRTMEAHPQRVRLKIRTQGTVVPAMVSTLVPEVAGRVSWVSPSLAPGAFFEEGEPLLTLDPRDFELAVVRIGAQLAQAEARLAREEAESEVARQEWEELGTGRATPLFLRIPQLEEARAAVAAARAALEQAELDLERTRLRAPFAGRVLEKNVDLGQFVNRGNPVATLYAVDYAEVNLHVPDAELAYVDLPLSFHAGENASGPPVRLEASFGGREQVWTGRVVRTGAEIDPRSRMVQVVARVEDPFGRGGRAAGVPLAPGMFVEAEILGRTFDGVMVLPRAALRGPDEVLVVDEEDRLRFRRVRVVRADGEEVLVDSGLEAGERVCLSPLDTVVDGMRVRTDPAEALP